MTRNLERIGEAARRDGKAKFTSVYHYVSDVDRLRECYEEQDGRKAVGVDGVSKQEYGRELEARLADLADRLGRLGYRPQPVKRVYIPKEGSPQGRPLGIPCLEDKIVQRAVADVLGQIYEADFLDCSYGYRPGRTQHQALDALGRTIQQQKVNYVVEADIKSFFTQVKHDWLMKFLGHRIGDHRLLRLIWRLLKGGVMEDGLVTASDEGVPQGGNLSPILSNIYLHYALDVWFEVRFRKSCRGQASLFRYADDFVACFQYRDDACRYENELRARLAEFDLAVEPTKTKLLPFGRFAAANARRAGKPSATFDFLGFTHRCGQTRNDHFKVKRETAKRKFRAKLNAFSDWLKRHRSRMPLGLLLQRARAKIDGHLNYYCITDNSQRCSTFIHLCTKLLHKWLNRQSQRRSFPWTRLTQVLRCLKWPTARVRHDLNPFQRPTSP